MHRPAVFVLLLASIKPCSAGYGLQLAGLYHTITASEESLAGSIRHGEVPTRLQDLFPRPPCPLIPVVPAYDRVIGRILPSHTPREYYEADLLKKLRNPCLRAKVLGLPCPYATAEPSAVVVVEVRARRYEAHPPNLLP